MTSLLTPPKLDNLLSFTEKALIRAYGELAEVGVYKGGSALAMLQVMSRLGKYRSMHLFDTFSGLPEPGPNDAPGMCRAGQWAADLAEAIKLLEPWGSRVHFHVGVFPESADGLEKSSFSLVHVDVDLEESVRACCEWFGPRMDRGGGMMVFDDYGSQDWRGVKPAVDFYFKDRVEPLKGCCQAVVHF